MLSRFSNFRQRVKHYTFEAVWREVLDSDTNRGRCASHWKCSLPFLFSPRKCILTVHDLLERPSARHVPLLCFPF